MKRAAAVAVGLLLAALPFLLYGTRTHPHAPHADHAPRHGGALFMLGDHHVELVRTDAHTSLFLSDAVRRPLRPRSGWLTLDDGSRLALRWQDDRLTAAIPPGRRARAFGLVTAEGTELELPVAGP